MFKKVKMMKFHIQEFIFLSIFTVFSAYGMTSSNLLSQKQLFIGAMKGNINLMNKALIEGADINSEYKDRTPLIIAALFGKKGSIIWLIQHGADVNKPSSTKGITPLIAASFPIYCIKSMLTMKEISKELINAGANVNYQMDRGESILGYAVISENLPLIKLLVEKGARIDQKNLKGKTAIDIAKDKQFNDIVEFLEKTRSENIKKRKEKIKKEVDQCFSTGQLGPLQYILEYADEYVPESEEEKELKE